MHVKVAVEITVAGLDLAAEQARLQVLAAERQLLRAGPQADDDAGPRFLQARPQALQADLQMSEAAGEDRPCAPAGRGLVDLAEARIVRRGGEPGGGPGPVPQDAGEGAARRPRSSPRSAPPY